MSIASMLDRIRRNDLLFTELDLTFSFSDPNGLVNLNNAIACLEALKTSRIVKKLAIEMTGQLDPYPPSYNAALHDKEKKARYDEWYQKYECIHKISNAEAFSFLKVNMTLTELKVSSSVSLGLLVGLLNENRALKVLRADNSCIYGTHDIGPLLKVHPALEVLSLNGSLTRVRGPYVTTHIPRDITHLTEALKENRVLKELDLGNNHFSGDGIKQLAAVLKINRTLEKLSLHGCLNNYSNSKGFSEGNLYDIVDLIEALKENRYLKSLDLGGNWFDEVGVKQLAAVLKVNHTLEDLSLALCGLKDITVLGESLKENTTLKRLDLRNPITDFTPLVALLQVNKTLTSLNLGNSCDE